MGPYAQITSDYDINSKNSLNASFKLSGMLNHTTSEIDNSLSFNAENYTPWFTNNTDVKTNRLGFDANLDYKRTFAKPHEELTMSAQLTNNNSNTNYYVYHDSVEVVNYQEKGERRDKQRSNFSGRLCLSVFKKGEFRNRDESHITQRKQ